MMRRPIGIACALACVAHTLPGAFAQAPMHAESATMPSPRHLTLREQFRYIHLDHDPSPRDREIDEITALSMVEYGLRNDLSLNLRIPVSVRWIDNQQWNDTELAAGVNDVTALLKWRLWKKDTGATDTARFAVLGGMEIRSGDSEFSSDSYDPIVGLAYTQVIGRHGVNLSASWKFTTDGDPYPILAGEGKADLLRYDAAYLYRIYPAKFDAESHGAWYAVAELNGTYETNGDFEILVSPCLMYEARTWVLELAVQLPTLQELDHRPETRFVIVAGLRFSI